MSEFRRITVDPDQCACADRIMRLVGGNVWVR